MNTIASSVTAVQAESGPTSSGAAWTGIEGNPWVAATPHIEPNTVADYLDAAVTPYAAGHLVSPEALSTIRQIGSLLPGAITDLFGFECPLGVREPRADFLVCSRASQGGREVLTGQRPGRDLALSLEAHPVWRRIRAFAREWSAPSSPLYAAIHNIWLEFDVDGAAPSVPVPSVFFGSEALQAPAEKAANTDVLPPHCAWLSTLALPLLLVQEVGLAPRRQIARCVNLLPPGARIFQVGLMLARISRVTRLCVRGISAPEIVEYLQALGWEGSALELETLVNSLASVVERIDLDLDVTDRVLPKVGLECYPAMSLPAIQRFLDFLAASGLATAEKAQALAQWGGMAHEQLTPDAWPRELLSVSRFLGGRVHSTFLRWLHHVKVVHEPAHPLQAKAYLAISHQWIAPADLKGMLSAAAALQKQILA